MKTGLNSTRTAASRQVAVMSAGTVAAAVATILAAHSGVARAADDEQGPQSAPAAVSLEEVIVTGYRKSLNAALDAKRDAVGSVDTIVAEDIAAFPELNLAESIQRIPGVSIQRDAGEGRQISVRGLGPQYTRVRINGMEALTTVSSSDANGGTNRDRSFDFNVFASELFNNITVHKTSSADIDEGSLGATVDLRTPRPFDYNGFTAVVGAKEDYNDLAGTLMPRYSGLISNTFADGMFGALVSVAYTKRAIVDDGSSTVRWMNGLNSDGSKSAANDFKTLGAGYTGPTLDQLNSAFRPRFPRYEEYHTDEGRLGITASLQFKPAEKTLINFDNLFAQFDATREEEQLENPTFSSNTNTAAAPGINGVIVRSATIDSHNNIVAGTFDNVDIRAEHRYDVYDTKFRQHVVSLEQGITDNLSFNGSIGYAQSILTQPESTTLIWDIYGVNGYSYDFSSSALNNRLPLLNYGSANVTDPNAFHLTQVRIRPGDVDNSFINYEGDLNYTVNDALKLKVGGQMKKYQFKTDLIRRANESAIPANIAALSPSSYGTTAHLTGLSDLPTGSIRDWAVPSLSIAQAQFGLNDPSVFPLSITPALGSNFNVYEKDTSAFTQADWSTDMLTVPIRGSLGVRWVHTDQLSLGYQTISGALQYAPAEHTYNDVLPSLNVVAEITKDFQVRASAAKVMSRAGLANLNPGSAVSFSGANKTVTSGNPNLDPIRGKAYDLGAEWYFAKESLVSAAIFYKKIDSFVETSRTVTNFSASGLPTDQAIAACTSAGKPTDATCLADWTVSVPINTPGGDIKGAELSFQQPFSFLPGWMSSFGTIVNYTYVSSSIKYVNTNAVPTAGVAQQYIENTLLGLSKNAANATLYYDNGTWSARFSASYRSPYLTNVPGQNLNDIEGTKQTINVDFASSWNVTEQFQLTLEALNLTNQFQYQYVDTSGNRMNYYHQQGRDFLVGARYKF